jgi:8-oxo-dGTP pyrophosphatase MutT (NUDIX family)
VQRLTWLRIEAALAARPPSRVAEVVSARAAVALILREGASGLEILFIRRAEHPQDPWSGQMAFPGGRAEPGEEDLKATAVRETAEEIGVDLERAADCLGILDEVRAMARLRPVSLTILPFVFRLREEVAPVLSDEVRSLHWIPLDDLLAAERRSVMDYVQEGATLQFPCLRVEDVVIWGLTYRMLLGLEERIPPPDACLPPSPPAGLLG